MPEFEVEGMRDEHIMSTQEGPKNINMQENEGVNDVVLRFNTEFDTADFKDPKVVEEYESDIKMVREFNPRQADILEGKLIGKLSEIEEINH